MPPERSSRSRRSERGNAFVELSLVLLPLFALLFAIFDFGVAIFLKSTFLHATREGVRYAITYQTIPGMSHDQSIKAVVQRNAMGFLGGESGLEKIKVRYYNPTTFQEVPDNDPGNIVEVSIEGYSWSWVAPLWRTAAPLMLTARSADRMEGLPPGVPRPPR